MVLHVLILPPLDPPEDEAHARARTQAHPTAGRAGSLVRPSEVRVAKRAFRPQGETDEDGKLAQIQTDLVEPSGSSSAVSLKLYVNVPSVPALATAVTQGASGRAASPATDGTTLGTATWPNR